MMHLNKTSKFQCMILTLLLVYFCVPGHFAFASGGDGMSENSLIPEYHVPAGELQIYARDNLRFIAPSYWRIYHFIAYRALTGHALSQTEINTLNVQGWKVGTQNGGWDYAEKTEQNGIDQWMTERNKLFGLPAQKLMSWLILAISITF